MKSEDHSELLPSPSHNHRPRLNHRTVISVAINKLSTPTGFFIFLILSYALGYLSHSPPDFSQSAADLHELSRFSTQCSKPVPPPDVRQTILGRVFNGTSPWQNFPPSHIHNMLFPDWKKGWDSENPVFGNLIRRVRPKIIIEVGTFMGASATHMADLTKQLGLETQIICVDDFRGWPGYYDDDKSLKMVNGDSLLMYQFMHNVAKVNATESILFLPFSAGTALGSLCEWGVYADLIEVDAAHDFQAAWSDINKAFKVLKPGGVLFGHDYFLAEDNFGVRRAADLFARLNGFRIQIDGEHWVMAPLD